MKQVKQVSNSKLIWLQLFSLGVRKMEHGPIKPGFQNKWSFGAFIASSKWHFLLILMYCESDANTILYCTYLLHTTCKQMIQFSAQKMYWANTTCKYQICIRLHKLGYLIPTYQYVLDICIL